MLTMGSLFAGIGGFELGLERTGGFKTAWQVENNKHCNRILERHWPGVARHTDVRDFHAADAIQPDIICGGFPCQDLSVAGARRGMAGGRSGLFFDFIRIIDEFSPRWVLIENVPGLLSSNGGLDMGTVLGSLAQLGYRWAYRILDAQYFGLAQRRKRVFIVGHLGNGQHPAEILLEPESVSWDSPPSREAGTSVAASLTSGSGVNSNAPGRRREDDVNIVANGITARYGKGTDSDMTDTMITVAPIDMRQASCGGKMTNNRKEGSSGGAPGTGIGEAGDPSPVVAYQCQGSNVGPMGTLRRGNGNETGGVPFIVGALAAHSKEHGHAMTTQQAAESGQLIPFDTTQITSDKNYSSPKPGDPCHPLATQQHAPVIASPMLVRRLMPVECERLQGFPDDWTRRDKDGKELSDSARYRMIGNAVAVPVAEWIGRRILEANGCASEPTKKTP